MVNVMDGNWKDSGDTVYRRGMKILDDAGISNSGAFSFGWSISVADSDLARARAVLLADEICKRFVIISEK
jgi:hypothetical protein